jgi:hypothetical protein
MAKLIGRYSLSEHLHEHQVSEHKPKTIACTNAIINRLTDVTVGKYNPKVYREKARIVNQYIESKLKEEKVQYEVISGSGVTNPLKRHKRYATAFDKEASYFKIKTNIDNIGGNKSFRVYVLPYTYSTNCKVKVVVIDELYNSSSNRWDEDLITNIKTIVKYNDIDALEYKQNWLSARSGFEVFEHDSKINLDLALDYITSYTPKYAELNAQSKKNEKIDSFTMGAKIAELIKPVRPLISPTYLDGFNKFINEQVKYYARNKSFQYWDKGEVTDNIILTSFDMKDGLPILVINYGNGGSLNLATKHINKDCIAEVIVEVTSIIQHLDNIKSLQTTLRN